MIGLKNSLKISLIANYVYYNYRANTDTKFSGIGETKNKAENPSVVSPRRKMVDAWNKMVEMYGELDYLPTSNLSYIHFNDYPSAYNFLLSNLADYPDWKFTQIEPINIWGFNMVVKKVYTEEIVNVVDAMSSIVSSVQSKYDSANGEKPYFHHGHPMEIINTLQIYQQSSTLRFKNFQ